MDKTQLLVWAVAFLHYGIGSLLLGGSPLIATMLVLFGLVALIAWFRAPPSKLGRREIVNYLAIIVAILVITDVAYIYAHFYR